MSGLIWLLLLWLGQAPRAAARVDQAVEDGHHVARGVEVAVDAASTSSMVVAVQVAVHNIGVLLAHPSTARLELEVPGLGARGRVLRVVVGTATLVTTLPAHL